MKVPGNDIDQLRLKLSELEEENAHLQQRHKEQRRLSRCLEAVNRTIIESTDLEELLDRVLQEFLTAFSCDRAWLLYPSDPDAATYRVPMERTNPQWSGAKTQGIDIPLDDYSRRVFELANATSGAVRFDAEVNSFYLDQDVCTQFHIRSLLLMAIHPRVGKSWLLGIHHCAASRVYSKHDCELFETLGSRLADGLSSLLSWLDTKSLFENSEVSIWNVDLSDVRSALDQFSDDGIENLRLHLSNNESVAQDLATLVKVVQVNQATLSLLGAETEAVLIGAVEKVFSANTLSVFIDALCAIWDEQKVFRSELALHTLDGKDLSVLVTFQVPESKGGFRSVPVSITDITERKRAEALIRQKEELYRSVVKDLPALVCRNRPDGVIEYVNDAYCNYFARSRDELIGKDFYELVPEQQRDQVRANFSVLSSDNPLMRHEHQVIDKNGRIRWQRWTNRAISDRQGQVVALQAFGEDITERKQAEERIRTLSQAIEQSPVSVVITDTDGNIEYVNSTFEKITGYRSADVIGQDSRILKSGKTPKGTFIDLWNTISRGQAWHGEFQNRKKSGEIFWEHAHIAPVFDEAGEACHYLAVKEDISLRKKQEEHILHQAHFDSLTDLPNRFLALDRLSQLINEAKRNQNLIAVLFLDLDDFKRINDTLGHEVGDKLLVKAAGRLRSLVRNSDTVGRLGGDEFIVIFGSLTEAVDVLPVVKNLLERFRDPFTVDSRELILTASVGIAIYPDDGDTPSQLLRNADSAMYHSKDQGRNTYSYFTEAMNRKVSRRLALEEQIHSALDRSEFTLCYQPQVDIGSSKIVGFEALLRWRNPVLGDISPVEFISIAEQNGVIVPIGRYVLNEALRMAARWRELHGQYVTMAINLSPRQFRDPDLVPFVKKSLKRFDFPAQFLELEITEGLLMNGHTYVDSALNALNDLGVSIAMDDFGTGYSSLSNLRAYPFDTLKIDRSFIKDITVDKADRELVNAAITMAHGLGLNIVAEGVETAGQLALLAEQGCDIAQGFLFSKPVPADEALGVNLSPAIPS